MTSSGSLIFAFFAGVSLLWGGGNPHYLVLSRKSAQCSVLAEDLSVIGQFPVAEGFTEGVVGADGRLLYLMSNGLFDLDGHKQIQKGLLQVYDIASGKLVVSHDLGWDSRGMVFSPDGRFLLCLSSGWRYLAKQSDADGLLTVVGTGDQKVAARIHAGRLLTQVQFTGDGSRLMVLASGRIYRAEPQRPTDYDWVRACTKSWKNDTETVPARIQTFSVPDLRPLNSIPLDDAPDGMLMRGDGTLLVIDRGMPHRSKARQVMGSLQLVDLNAGKVLARQSTGAGPVLAADTKDASRFLVLSGSNFNACQLEISQWTNQRLERYPEAGQKDTCPFSVVKAGSGGKLVLSLSKSCWNWGGELRNEVAVVDVSSGKVERMVGTGRRGLRIAKKVGMVATVLAFPVPAMAVGLAIAAPETIDVPKRI